MRGDQAATSAFHASAPPADVGPLPLAVAAMPSLPSIALVDESARGAAGQLATLLSLLNHQAYKKELAVSSGRIETLSERCGLCHSCEKMAQKAVGEAQMEWEKEKGRIMDAETASAALLCPCA